MLESTILSLLWSLWATGYPWFRIVPTFRKGSFTIDDSITLKIVTMAVVVAEPAEKFPRIGRNHFRVVTPHALVLTGQARDL